MSRADRGVLLAEMLARTRRKGKHFSLHRKKENIKDVTNCVAVREDERRRREAMRARCAQEGHWRVFLVREIRFWVCSACSAERTLPRHLGMLSSN